MRPPVDYMCCCFGFISFNFPKIVEYCSFTWHLTIKIKSVRSLNGKEEETELVVFCRVYSFGFNFMFVSLRKTLFANFYAVFADCEFTSF